MLQHIGFMQTSLSQCRKSYWSQSIVTEPVRRLWNSLGAWGWGLNAGENCLTSSGYSGIWVWREWCNTVVTPRTQVRIKSSEVPGFLYKWRSGFNAHNHFLHRPHFFFKSIIYIRLADCTEWVYNRYMCVPYILSMVVSVSDTCLVSLSRQNI